ncbi:DMT family transporter [Streptomyces sp. H27-D2]|uniref:DMT family transporter n=1 Tax=Streptomyces sp. H27-D2 TaxID=3046304 RepID=UPI002DBA46E6|nr:multidrug efflux SMR transporter [Streptomyces sp. H27-D2]MEC4020808.1 multidrug efflux SMR transporter [Streptomyces sp. H27-D2]
MTYLMLAGAIIAEVLGTTSMKYSDGFSKLWPSLGTALGYGIAFYLLAQTLRTMEVGTVYAIWSGAGTAIIAAIGMAFLGESASAVKLLGIGLVIAGVAVLNLGGGH